MRTLDGVPLVPRICVECRHMTRALAHVEAQRNRCVYLCLSRPRINYVTGAKTPEECEQKNTAGTCPEWQEREK
jgi:hypothetical protein